MLQALTILTTNIWTRYHNEFGRFNNQSKIEPASLEKVQNQLQVSGENWGTMPNGMLKKPYFLIQSSLLNFDKDMRLIMELMEQ